MEQFPHLKLVQKITGKPRIHGGGAEKEETAANKNDRSGHAGRLSGQILDVENSWTSSIAERENTDLALLDPDLIPIFLKINPDLLGAINFDFSQWGIEIISEENDGYILGASIDGMRSLREKIEGFLVIEKGTAKIADLWGILTGSREAWKPELVLSEELLEKWPDIQDGQNYWLEVSIAFDRPLGAEPDPHLRDGLRRLEKYQALNQERDQRYLDRENHFDAFISNYGRRTSSLVEYEDSFSCEVEINGRGLKDLVVAYPFVFEVAEKDEIENILAEAQLELQGDFDVIAPEPGSPEIAVVDSGIMEQHSYLSMAIDPRKSKCDIATETATADFTGGGGHGTKVAGAILYPRGITGISSPYRLPFFIRNLRVLNNDRELTARFPAELMKTIVNENKECKIFNLSLASSTPFRKKHMSTWAASIDELSHQHDILFVATTGNINPTRIRNYILLGDNYPSYLQRLECRIANPSQSSFALTVGSINRATFEDEVWGSLGSEDEVSAFSRTGLGIWGEIKPDVVEYGGGLVLAKNASKIVKEHTELCPELIRSTLHGGPAYNSETAGTSFATPKVSYIAGQLKKLYPGENIHLIRALIIQGARLPGPFFRHPTFESIQHFGYGLPSLERVTKNAEHRISFYTTQKIRAEEGHVYSIRLPDRLTDAGEDYDILIEVTLAYSAKVRRTRQKTKSYLGTWLDWSSSKLDETFEDYKNYTLSVIAGTQTEYDRVLRKTKDTYPWKLTDRDAGAVTGINRNKSTVQKDWAIISSNRLSGDINFAVHGHKSWDKNWEEVPYAFTVSIEVLGSNIPLYEMIRIENQIEIEV
jgi:hypothetical protein